MTRQVGRWRVTYTPGDWALLAGPTSLVVLEPAAADDPELVNALWEEVVASSSIAELASRLASSGIDAMPTFAALFWGQDGMRSLIRGAIVVTNLADGRMVADGTGVQTWTEVGLSAVEHVRVDMQAPDQSHIQLPLVVGAARAASVVLDARESAVVRSPQLEATGYPDPGELADVPTPEVETGGSAEEAASAWTHAAWGAASAEGLGGTMDEEDPEQHTPTTGWYPPPEKSYDPDNAATELLQLPDNLEGDASGAETAPFPQPTVYGTEPTPVPPPPPGRLQGWYDEPAYSPPPIGEPHPADDEPVLSVLCPDGHLNPPPGRACRICGQPVPRQTPSLRSRPSLATVVAPDGSVLDLDRAILVGRAPLADPADLPAARLMTVASPAQDISRTHLRIEPQGWQIMVTDLHSTNGTALVTGDSTTDPLPPGEAVAVPVGSVLQLGEGVAVLIQPPRPGGRQ